MKSYISLLYILIILMITYNFLSIIEYSNIEAAIECETLFNFGEI